MAQTMSVDDVLRHIRKASLFIEGITVSGGEATTQLPFIVALFTAIKADPQLQRLTCTVDSNGQLSETGWQKLLPVCDGVMLDLKAWKSECHHRLTDVVTRILSTVSAFLLRGENWRSCGCWLSRVRWTMRRISIHWRRLLLRWARFRCV